MRCGLLEHGLLRLACRTCGHAMLVAFSCKRRGFCPSCLGRRMSDLAAHLVDEVLPELPIRQWVCSLPWRLRYAMGFDRRLCSDVLGAWMDALERSLRWRAKRELGLSSVLARYGRSLEGLDDAADELVLEQPVLASCYAASASDVQLLGQEPGQRTRKLARPARLTETTSIDALAEVGGVNVHAKVVIDGRDRARLERLCRYIARPPLAQDRLELHGDGRVRYAFKRAWKDGTHAVLLEPLDLIARLCALVPPPKFHMLRYHGVLAAHAKLRAEVVGTLAPVADAEPPAAVQLELLDGEPVAARPTRHAWAWLLRRVFAADVSRCAECGGTMRIIDLATSRACVARVLAELGLAPRPPPRPRPAWPGQLSLKF